MTAVAKPYHHGRLKPALLHAALALLEEEGVDAVTIRAVARRLGVAHSAPANHFKDRRALLTGLATEIFRERAEIAERLLRGKQQATSGEAIKERIAAFACDWFAFGLKHPHRYRLIWRRDCLDPDDHILNQQMDRIYDPLVALFAGGRGDRHVSPESQATALWSLLHGYLSMRLDGNLVAKPDEISGAPREEAILAVLLGGLPLGGPKV